MAQKSIFPDQVLEFESTIRAQKLRDSVQRLWGVEVFQCDARGKIVSTHAAPSTPSANPICSCCGQNGETGRSRASLAKELAKQLLQSHAKAPETHVLCSCGLTYAAAPVMDEDVFLGAFLMGGFLDASSRAEAFEESPQSIPILTAGEVKSALQILHFIADEFLLFYRKRRQALDPLVGRPFREEFKGMVGTSNKMRQLYALLEKLRETESTVLIQGENGTGKEMVAKAIHESSPRAHRPFVTANCSAFNENLLDSEFFGHVKGAFTGAVRDKKGLFEVANGGTFFLDEIGDMAPALQVKLLRVLQEGTFTPIGSTVVRQVDVRIIAATNRNLKEMVEEGDFREDLYYRINVINIPVPPLRDRLEDIPLLAAHFLRTFSRSAPKSAKSFSKDAMNALLAYDWPGNVRQLENEIQRAVVLSGKSQEIELHHLSPSLKTASSHLTQVRVGGKLKKALERVERQILAEGLKRHRGNKSRLSRELGVSRATLISKVQKYGIDRNYQT